MADVGEREKCGAGFAAIVAAAVGIILVIVYLIALGKSRREDRGKDGFLYTPRCEFVDYGGHNSPHYFRVPEEPGFPCRGITSGSMPSIDPAFSGSLRACNPYCGDPSD
jgi:hypothetical protein